MEETALPLLARGINTVDSFDIHDKIVDLRRSLGAQAIKHDSVAVISAGWDPGTDSVMRSMMLAMAPKGITYTNFGPGMSMGHSVVARSKEGVEDALSLTIPTGSGVHRRMVYVVLKEGAKFSDVELAIKSDSYFSHDDTRVQQVPDIDALKDMGHGVLMERKGVSGTTQNQMFKFEMRINNPALTAQVMVASARASMKLGAGCYTLPEIAPMDFLPGVLGLRAVHNYGAAWSSFSGMVMPRFSSSSMMTSWMRLPAAIIMPCAFSIISPVASAVSSAASSTAFLASFAAFLASCAPSSMTFLPSRSACPIMPSSAQPASRDMVSTATRASPVIFFIVSSSLYLKCSHRA